MALGWLMNLDFAASDDGSPPVVAASFGDGLNTPRRGNIRTYAATLLNPLLALARASLFPSRLPDAVLRRVAPVVIDPPDRVGHGGALPHVGNELLIGVPSWVNCDASAAVSRIVYSLGIATSLLHRLPRAVSRGYSTNRRCPVPFDPTLSTFGRFAGDQIGTEGASLISAGAQTYPPTLGTQYSRLHTNDGQAAKGFPSKLKSLRHTRSSQSIATWRIT